MEKALCMSCSRWNESAVVPRGKRPLQLPVQPQKSFPVPAFFVFSFLLHKTNCQNKVCRGSTLQRSLKAEHLWSLVFGGEFQQAFCLPPTQVMCGYWLPFPILSLPLIPQKRNSVCLLLTLGSYKMQATSWAKLVFLKEKYRGSTFHTCTYEQYRPNLTTPTQ